MTLNIRNATLEDLEDITYLEAESFSEAEADTKEAFAERLQLIADSFLVIEEAGELLGYVNGPVVEQVYITDNLFQTVEANPLEGGNQCILGLSVSAKAKGRGLSLLLMEAFEQQAQQKHRESVSLTCHEELIHFYEKMGYINHGRSESTLGGAEWYNLVKPLALV